LQAAGLDGKTPRHTTVEEMAAHYVQEIRSLQPSGPYHLAGFSMAGLIAFEIAQQLVRNGERVAFLALIDTPPTSTHAATYWAGMVPYFADRARYHVHRWRRMPARYRVAYVAKCWAGLRWWAARNAPQPRVVTAPPEKCEEPPRVPGFSDYYWAVASSYQLRRYPGTIDFFLGESINRKFASVWRQLARGGARLHRVPGKHLEMVARERLPILAHALEAALQIAQRDGARTK
jgi:acetoacetyl-CoA synthetase